MSKFMQRPLSFCLFLRWCGDSRTGHLWHHAVHSESHLHLVCWPSGKHGQLTPGSRNDRHEAFTAQCPHHGSPAFRRGQSKLVSLWVLVSWCKEGNNIQCAVCPGSGHWHCYPGWRDPEAEKTDQQHLRQTHGPVTGDHWYVCAAHYHNTVQT